MNETVLFESNEGVRFTRKDFKKRSQIAVRWFDGSYIMDYRINNVPLYNHPLLSWENLNCCNGWKYDEEYEKTAVQRGLKPAATIVRWDSYVDLAEAEKEKAEVWHDPDTAWNERCTRYYTIVTRKCCLKDLFDVDTIVDAYRKHDVNICKKDLEPWFNRPIMELMRLWHENEFFIEGLATQPATSLQRLKYNFIITGLMLGYPIESTAGLLYRHGLRF